MGPIRGYEFERYNYAGHAMRMEFLRSTALRIRAIEDGISATKLVEGLILDYLKTRPK